MGRRLEPQQALGRVVRRERNARGLTQKQLAEAADLDVTWLSRLERGSTNPAIGTVRRVADALGLAASELIARAESMETDDS
jgi:transcriptional regulator with XRE-family HTH domain